MEKERMSLVAQLLTTLQDSVKKLESFYVNKNAEGLNEAKREILALQIKIDRLI